MGMKNLHKSLIFVFVLLFLVSFVSAENIISDVQNDVSNIKQVLQSKLAYIATLNNPYDQVLIIEGAKINTVEKTAMDIAKQKNPYLSEFKTLNDTKETLNEVKSVNKTLILIGGVSQNSVTKYFVEKGLIDISDVDNGNGSIFTVSTGKNEVNYNIIVISDKRGYNNIEKESAKNSPLSNFIPEKYVPVTASAIAIILMYLVSFSKIFGGKFIVSKFGKKSVTHKEHYIGFKIKHFDVKIREYISIFVAVLIAALAVALSFHGFNMKVLQTVKITLLVSLIIVIIREGIRFIVCYLKRLHMEYKIWYTGAFISLFSGYLGNTLSTTGVLFDIKDEHFSFEKATHMKYWILILTFVFGVLFFFLNLLDPSKVFQMIMTSTTTLALAEIIPVAPLAGKDILKWKPWIWSFTALIVVTGYIMINFVI